MLDLLPLNIRRAGISRVKLVAVAVVVFITLAVIAVGFSALEQPANSKASTVYGEPTQAGDTSAVSAFKFVCPFH